jgi:hypothetical protein
MCGAARGDEEICTEANASVLFFGLANSIFPRDISKLFSLLTRESIVEVACC